MVYLQSGLNVRGYGMCLWCVFPGTCLGVDVDDGGVEDEQPSPPPLRGELGAAGQLAPHAVSPSVGGEGEGGGSHHITAVTCTSLQI